MATTSHKAYTQTATTILSTELNSLGSGSISAASSAIDNTTNLDLFMDLELVLAAQGAARSSGATVSVAIVPSLDGGTNYPDVVDGNNEVVAVFPLDAATTARRQVRRDVAIPPGLFKLYVRNSTGQAFAASGSTIRYRTHSITTA